MVRNRGFIAPELYAALAMLAVLVIGFGYIQTLRLKNARLETENALMVSENTRLVTEVAVGKQLAEANRIRNEAANDAKIESALRAEREKQRVTADRLAEDSAKKAKLVEGLAHKAIQNNVDVLNCMSDLRNTEKDCGHVR